MTFTAMHPTSMATTLGYGPQQQISPLQFGQQIPQVQQQMAGIGVLQQEEQILPQEHLVSPVTFWTKVARYSARYGAHAARQMLEGVLYQHQVQQQLQLQIQQQVLPPQVLQALQAIQAQVAQLPQVYGQQFAQQYGQQYGQPYAAQQFAQHPGVLQQLGIQPVAPQHLQAAYGQQIPLSMQPLHQVYGQPYGQAQQAAQQVPVAAGAAL